MPSTQSDCDIDQTIMLAAPYAQKLRSALHEINESQRACVPFVLTNGDLVEAVSEGSSANNDVAIKFQCFQSVLEHLSDWMEGGKPAVYDLGIEQSDEYHWVENRLSESVYPGTNGIRLNFEPWDSRTECASLCIFDDPETPVMLFPTSAPTKICTVMRETLCRALTHQCRQGIGLYRQEYADSEACLDAELLQGVEDYLAQIIETCFEWRH